MTSKKNKRKQRIFTSGPPLLTKVSRYLEWILPIIKASYLFAWIHPSPPWLRGRGWIGDNPLALVYPSPLKSVKKHAWYDVTYCGGGALIAPNASTQTNMPLLERMKIKQKYTCRLILVIKCSSTILLNHHVWNFTFLKCFDIISVMKTHFFSSFSSNSFKMHKYAVKVAFLSFQFDITSKFHFQRFHNCTCTSIPLS